MPRTFGYQGVFAGIGSILLIAMLGALFAPLSVCDLPFPSENEPNIVTLDVCHVGDAGVSVNAESPLFAEFRPEQILFGAPVSTVFLINQPYALLFVASKYRPPEC